MKTPSCLSLLILFAALPAAAAPKPGERCDTTFLEKVVNDFRAGGTVPDARIIDQVVEGVNRPVLKLGDVGICDAGTWRLVVGSFSVPDIKKYWNSNNAGRQAEIMLIADDFYKAIDPKIAEVLAAADEVTETGVALGIVKTSEISKTQSDFLKRNSGGAMAGAAPKEVVFTSPTAPGTVTRESLGLALRKVLDEQGKEGGTAVKRFRLAVLALGEDIAVLGQANTAVIRRSGAALPGVKDFLPRLPSPITAPAFSKENAADPKFKDALEALVGKGVNALDEPEPKARFLSSLDIGLNNLIAIRSAQIDRIVTAAKPRLGGKTITQLEVSLRATEAVSDLPPDALARSVMDILSKTPHYAKLDALYENNKREQGDAWVNSQAGKDMAAARKELLEAARSAKVEVIDGGKEIVYTQGGKKIVLNGLVPSSVEERASYREAVAAIIAGHILEGALADAKYQAVLASIGGLGQPGESLDTGIKPGAETEISNKVPPATKKIMDGAAGCDNPKDLVRNDYETYAARRRAAAAEMAGANISSRNEVEVKRLEQLTASDLTCKEKKAAAAAIKQDFFDDPSIAKAEREKASAEAEAWCIASKKAIEDEAQAKIAELAVKERGDRDPAKLLAQADADLAAGFAVRIDETIDALRKEYTTNGNSRRKKLAELTGNSDKLSGHIERWFRLTWPHESSQQAVLEAALADCAAKLGFKPGSDKVSYHNPESLNNVDKYCQIGEKMTQFILDQKGSRRIVEGE